MFALFACGALALGVCRAGQLVTNDGSFFAPAPCATQPAPMPSQAGGNVNTLLTVIAGKPGTSINICQMNFGILSAAVAFTGVFFSYGTGTNCGTTNVVFESSSLFEGNSTLGGEFSSPWGFPLYTLPAGDNLCVEWTGSGNGTSGSGTVKYYQQ